MAYMGVVVIGGITGHYLSKSRNDMKNRMLWMLIAIVISLGLHILCAYQFEDDLTYFIYYMTSILLLTIGYVDYRELYVPMDLILVGVILGIYLNMTSPALNGWMNLMSAIVTFLVLVMISRLSRGGFGEGDAYVMALIGLFYGGFYIVILGMIALILSGVFSLIYLIMGKADRKTLLPFVPFLAAAHLLLVWI
jgi:leader peptidase (prepilin peptidase)/N-methyltransferase